MKTIRKACVQAIFDEFETRGELVTRSRMGMLRP